MEKILITGTGRSGTTFLIKLFTFLGYDTGFTKENYKKFIYKNCNSGLEKSYKENHYILKNPLFLENINEIINDKNIIIKLVIIPIRDYSLSAKSRVNHKKKHGGLWNAETEEEQIQFYYKIISNYVFYMTKFNIPTIFIDFDNMVTNKEYLFNKLKNILDEKNINYELFSKVYQEISML
jgi:hypothetical protein